MKFWPPSSPERNGRHFADDIFKRTFLKEKMLELRLKFHWFFFPGGPLDNKSALGRVMAWRRTGDKPLPEPMQSIPPRCRIYAALGGDDLTKRLNSDESRDITRSFLPMHTHSSPRAMGCLLGVQSVISYLSVERVPMRMRLSDLTGVSSPLMKLSTLGCTLMLTTLNRKEVIGHKVYMEISRIANTSYCVAAHIHDLAPRPYCILWLVNSLRPNGANMHQ